MVEMGTRMWSPQKELQSLFLQLSRGRVLWCHHERGNSILSINIFKKILKELNCSSIFKGNMDSSQAGMHCDGLELGKITGEKIL